MIEVLSTTVAFIVILGILVFFHELGHFTAAKTLGMKVEEFAFGFGPRLVRLFKRKETEYNIRAIPLGGFVRMPGMEPGDETTTEGFNSQPLWKRATVVFAGPFASFLLGYLVFVLIGVTVGFPAKNAKPQPVVSMVQPGTPADKVGLKAGDRILEMNGRKIANGQQMLNVVHANPGKAMNIVLKRGSKVITLKATPEPQPIIESVSKEQAASKNGLRPGDRVLSVSGKRIETGKDLLIVASTRSDQSLKVQVSRWIKDGEKTITVQAPPEALGKITGLLGFMPKIPMERTSFTESITYGTRMTVNYIDQLLNIFTSKEKMKSVGGVVAIARVTEKTTESGMDALLLEIGMLSLGLAIINLVPWPVLDGGHLLFMFIEWVRGGRKLSVEQQAAITSLGLATLVFLAVLMIYVDITRWVSGTPLQ